MERQLLHQKINFILLLLIAFTLPLLTVINTYLIILLATNWLVSGKYTEKFKMLKQQKLSWLFIGFFAVHLLGLIYSSDLNEGLHDIRQKLSLLIFPLILASTPEIDQINVRKIATAFGAGVLIATIICITAAVAGYIEKGTIEVFFYHELAGTVNMNAIYLSLYCTFCLILIFYYFIGKSFSKKILIPLSFWFILFIILLNSKLFIILTFLIINIFVISLLLKYKNRKIAIAGLIGCNLLLLLLVFQLNPIKERFTAEAIAPINVITQDQYKYDTPFSGYTLRLTFWRFALEILQEQQAFILGVGTGDGQQLLDKKYKERNIFTGDPRRGDSGYLGWNVHNQYFQVLLHFGILGLLYFLSLLAIPFLISLRQRQWLYAFFILLITAISLTESILETHKGVVFYSFFTSLLAFNYLNIKKGLKPKVEKEMELTST